MASWGILDKQSPTGIAGHYLTTAPGPTILHLLWGDIVLRTIKPTGNRFSFGMDQRFTSLLPAGTVLDVRFADGPSFKRGFGIAPIGESTDGGNTLKEMLSSGYELDKWGSLKLPFHSKSAEQRQMYAKGMEDIAAYFKTHFDKILFPHYGTLLGFARDGEFIPHDDDTDMSYISTAPTIAEAVDEFYDIMQAIKDAGHSIWVVNAGQASVTLRGYNHIGTDVFLSWRQPNGTFFTYFGVLGEIRHEIEFQRTRFEGVEVNIPTNYEEILEYTYGRSWRVPDPNFVWSEPKALAAMLKAFRSAGAERLQAFRSQK